MRPPCGPTCWARTTRLLREAERADWNAPLRGTLAPASACFEETIEVCMVAVRAKGTKYLV